MKNIFAVLIFSLVASFAFAKTVQASDDASVNLIGPKAADLLDLMEKTKASSAGEKDSCGAGSCHQQGSLDVLCQSPMNDQEQGMTSDCSVSAAGKNGNQVSLSDAKAKKMMNLLESSHAMEFNPDADCDHGTCHKKGAISVICTYPKNRKEKDQYSCTISPVVSKKGSAKKAAPSKSESGGQ